MLRDRLYSIQPSGNALMRRAAADIRAGAFSRWWSRFSSLSLSADTTQQSHHSRSESAARAAVLSTLMTRRTSHRDLGGLRAARGVVPVIFAGAAATARRSTARTTEAFH
jgi:hypothetical protein